MLEKMKALLRENSLCVLATCSENMPHCSLMTYITDEQAEAIHTVTLNTSRKYRNIRQNPRVSLLVDTRLKDGSEAGDIKALTISGVSSFVSDETERVAILTRIGQNHPQLRDLVLHPDAEVITIEVECFLLLEGPTHAYFAQVSKQA
jgi:nitroimidazol reductase NimA-like FMN-containing flavoprotein (pyridoxamine 5'-phosphate oxidase superfamily)